MGGGGDNGTILWWFSHTHWLKNHLITDGILQGDCAVSSWICKEDSLAGKRQRGSRQKDEAGTGYTLEVNAGEKRQKQAKEQKNNGTGRGKTEEEWLLALRKKSRVVEQLNARRAESWNSSTQEEQSRGTARQKTESWNKRKGQVGQVDCSHWKTVSTSIGRLMTFLFYVPEHSIMYLTVTSWFLIRFAFSWILDFSECCIIFLNRTSVIKKYYACVL